MAVSSNTIISFFRNQANQILHAGAELHTQEECQALLTKFDEGLTHLWSRCVNPTTSQEDCVNALALAWLRKLASWLMAQEPAPIKLELATLTDSFLRAVQVYVPFNKLEWACKKQGVCSIL